MPRSESSSHLLLSPLSPVMSWNSCFSDLFQLFSNILIPGGQPYFFSLNCQSPHFTILFSYEMSIFHISVHVSELFPWTKNSLPVALLEWVPVNNISENDLINFGWRAVEITFKRKNSQSFGLPATPSRKLHFKNVWAWIKSGWCGGTGLVTHKLNAMQCWPWSWSWEAKDTVSEWA